MIRAPAQNVLINNQKYFGFGMSRTSDLIRQRIARATESERQRLMSELIASWLTYEANECALGLTFIADADSNLDLYERRPSSFEYAACFGKGPASRFCE